jgi:hypothetical protein
MRDANLEGAVLSDANLATAQQLTPEQIEPALTNAGTSLPEGLEIPPDF